MSNRSGDSRSRPRLPWLLALLAIAGGAFLATGSMRRHALIRSELIRRQVDQAEELAEQELALRRSRGERADLLRRLEHSPEDPALLLKVGALFARDRRYEDAQFYLQEARRLRPDDPEPYRALYQGAMAQAHYDRAYDYAVAGLERNPRDLELVLGLVHLDSLVGWNGHARRQLQLLEGTPEARNPRALVASALIYRQVANSRQAEAELREAVRLDPVNDRALALLSGIQWEAGESREAEESIRKALALSPDNADYLLHLSEIELRRRDAASAAASLRTAEQALRADPGNRNAFFAMALAQAALGNREEAREILERLLQRFPGHPHAALELGRLYSRMGRATEAQRMLARYRDSLARQEVLKGLTLKVAMLPDASEPHSDLGRAYNDAHEPEKAILVLRRALQLRPRHPKAVRELARALAARGREGEFFELAAHPGWRVSDPLSRTPG